MKQTTLQSDITIVGAGVVGLMMAALLNRQGFSVFIIEANASQVNEADSADPRALAITLASQRLLQKTGIWSELPEDRIGHFRKMFVWNENGDGSIEFHPEDLAEADLACSIESSVLQNVMQEQLNKKEQIRFFQPASLGSIEYADDNALICLQDGRRLESKLVIAADGQRSRVREMSGIGYAAKSYGQNAIACVIETEYPHEDTARQRFLKEGILAFLPMAKPNQCSIVWSTEIRRADELMSMEKEVFQKILSRTSDNILGEVIDSGDRVAFPLQHGQADHYCQARLALIGDAAHSVHPLAGQGANLGFMDAAVLAETVFNAKQRGSDIGYHQVLRRYERWRRGENIFMMNVFSGFKWLFENQQQPVPILRNTGLKLVNRCNPLKQSIMQRAMGRSGDLPDILRL